MAVHFNVFVALATLLISAVRVTGGVTSVVGLSFCFFGVFFVVPVVVPEVSFPSFPVLEELERLASAADADTVFVVSVFVG